MVQGAAFRILACFYDTDEASFVDLCSRAGYPTDLGGYYIRQLVKSGHLEKVDRGKYHILPEGKRQLALYYGKHFLEAKPRLSVLIVPRQQDRFWVLRRTVQPFLGTYEWPAGVVDGSEPLHAAAARILEQRLGSKAELLLLGFYRRIDLFDDKPFDDKLFALYTCSIDPEANVSPKATTGENLPFTEAELRGLDHPSRSLFDILDYVLGDKHHLVEHTYNLSKQDLSPPPETT